MAYLSADRDQLIYYIDDTYNTASKGQLLEQTMIDMFGDQLLDEDGNWSDESPDGMYTNLSTLDLAELATKLDELTAAEVTKVFKVTLELTTSQLITLKTALSDFSDPHFTKDRQMSKDAQNILRQL